MKRQSNIELCRLFAIACIVITHSVGEYIIPGQGEVARPAYWWMAVGSSLGVLGPNIFVLISGLFSVKSKKAAYMNLLYLCLFYLFVRIGVCVVTGNSIPSTTFLFVSKSNWFVPMYLGLLLLAPVLNSYIDKTDKRTLGLMTLALLAYDVWSDWYPGGLTERGGYTIINFIAMYFAGRYIGLHGVGKLVSRLAPIAFMLCISVTSFLTFYAIQRGLDSWVIFKLSANNCPLVMAASLSLFLTFKGMNLGHSKLINHCAKSVLGILLFHSFSASHAFLTQHYNTLYDNYKGLALFGFWIGSVLLTVVVGIAIDQIRIYTYDKLSSVVSNPTTKS